MDTIGMTFFDIIENNFINYNINQTNLNVRLNKKIMKLGQWNNWKNPRRENISKLASKLILCVI